MRPSSGDLIGGDVEKGAEELDVPLQEHIAITLEAMKTVASKMGLDVLTAK